MKVTKSTFNRLFSIFIMVMAVIFWCQWSGADG